MSRVTLIVTIIVLLILTSLMIAILNAIYNDMNQQTVTTEMTQCNHEFVISSKYNWYLHSYRTMSVCTKCGMEI